MGQTPVKFYDRTLSAEARAEIERIARRDYRTDNVKFLDVRPGYGRHTHDSKCRESCMKYCEDSDVIVEIEYGESGYRALYGVKDQKVYLWAD